MAKKAKILEQKSSFLQKYGLYVLISLITIIVFIVFYDFIVFDKLYLFKGLASDSLNDTYPNYILISDYLRTDGLPKWSFRQGMGQSIFPFSFPDPFVSFLYVLGRENLAYGLAYMEILKIFLAGILFYLFLKKLSLSEYVCIIGGLLCSFSSFMIIGSCWNWFSTDVVYMALLLLAFEKLYQDDSWLWFPVAIALIAVLQPFDLWLLGLFLFIYMMVRYFEENERNPRKFFLTFLKALGLGCLGVGISSFFFLSELRMIFNSPRGLEGVAGFTNRLLSEPVLGFESGLHYLTALMRLFSSEMLGPSNAFSGWFNFMEAPLFYCGLVNLLLFPQLFPFLNRRKKIVYSLWLIVFILPVVFPFLRYAVYLFTGSYYRLYSFFVAFVLIFFSIKALDHICKTAQVNLKLLGITLVILLVALFYPYNYFEQHAILNQDIRNKVAAILVLYAFTIALFRYKAGLIYVQALLLLFISIELINFSSVNVNERQSMTSEEHQQRTGYSDYTTEAIAYIKKRDKTFFRVSKDYTSAPTWDQSLNDSKIQGYKGTTSYHSFNQIYYVNFLSSLGMINAREEGATRWLYGLRDAPVFHSFASVNYYLSKTKNPLVYMYDSLSIEGDVRIYRNKHPLPLGFTYSHFIRKKDFLLTPPARKASILYKAAIVNDSVFGKQMRGFPVLNEKSISDSYQGEEYIADINKLRGDTLAISQFNNNNIKGTIRLQEKKMLFFSIPFSVGWSAEVNGSEQELIRVNIGFMGLLLDKGEHRVELSFTPPLLNMGAILSVVSILLYMVLLFMHNRKRQIKSSTA